MEVSKPLQSGFCILDSATWLAFCCGGGVALFLQKVVLVLVQYLLCLVEFFCVGGGGFGVWFSVFHVSLLSV